MTITLTPEHEELVAKAMETGAYQDPTEVVVRALEVLNSENDWLRDQRSEIAGKIERAFEQFERGEFFSAEGAETDMAKRKAAWIRERKR